MILGTPLYYDKWGNLKYHPWKCNGCGRFIAHADIGSGEARVKMVTPDSDVSEEEWDCMCKKCLEKQKE